MIFVDKHFENVEKVLDENAFLGVNSKQVGRGGRSSALSCN